MPMVYSVKNIFWQLELISSQETINMGGENVRLQIWDRASEERSRAPITAYCRGTSAFLLLFDLSERASFEHLDHWIDKINGANPGKHIIIVGNKADLHNLLQMMKHILMHHQRI
eukprot:gnl/Chilomastix_caulleri/6422.p1 GENE.gnl/Chilomastix_caulleri/6422~~gnl/Chilomastix_caulleri/6422.p1  ORF type:complete len:115 (+),score=6.30 gnl/Chilomastix_caulleri/6422:94-438(+)